MTLYNSWAVSRGALMTGTENLCDPVLVRFQFGGSPSRTGRAWGGGAPGEDPPQGFPMLPRPGQPSTGIDPPLAGLEIEGGVDVTFRIGGKGIKVRWLKIEAQQSQKFSLRGKGVVCRLLKRQAWGGRSGDYLGFTSVNFRLSIFVSICKSTTL